VSPADLKTVSDNVQPVTIKNEDKISAPVFFEKDVKSDSPEKNFPISIDFQKVVVETRGRKEIELLDYVKHVRDENDKNDSKIAQLRAEKELLQGQSRLDKADAIARIMREKTTRKRRLRDRERFLI
jgi:hypothetical protein